MLLGFLLCRSPARRSDHLQVGLGAGEEPAAGCWPHLSLAMLLGPPAWGPAALWARVCRLRQE